jgi:hypothetical protein
VSVVSSTMKTGDWFARLAFARLAFLGGEHVKRLTSSNEDTADTTETPTRRADFRGRTCLWGFDRTGRSAGVG